MVAREAAVTAGRVGGTGGGSIVPMRMSVKVVCPRCGQGWVTEQVVVETGDRWWVCEECDAVWHVLEPVRAPGFETLSNLLALRGLTSSGVELREPRPSDPDPVAGLDEAFERSHAPDPAARVEGVVALAPAVLTSGAGPRLAELLNDPEQQVATAAATGLARYGDESSLQAVAARVRESDGAARAALVQAVGDVAARYVFTAHRLVLLLDAGEDWPADLEQVLRDAVTTHDGR